MNLALSQEMWRSSRGKWIFRSETGTGRACRAAMKRPSLPFARLQAALRLRPRRAGTFPTVQF